MKILGIGVDIVENKRIRDLIQKKAFLKRTYSPKELKLANKRFKHVSYFANRFAAKEAFAKSIGTGFRNNLNFRDIEILNDKIGKPYYLKSKKIEKIIIKIFKTKKFNLFLSISDEKDYSVAFTIVQKI